VLFTETVAADVTAGTSTDYDLLARTPFAQLRVVDAGTGSGAVTLIAYLR
jgi:methylase of polypeptide subunit release factors